MFQLQYEIKIINSRLRIGGVTGPWSSGVELTGEAGGGDEIEGKLGEGSLGGGGGGAKATDSGLWP